MASLRLLNENKLLRFEEKLMGNYTSIAWDPNLQAWHHLCCSFKMSTAIKIVLHEILDSPIVEPRVG
jgi:hypothetical protein